MKIGIVNDVRIAVQAIALAIKAGGRHDVLWTAADGDEALALCLNSRPDLVLMDLIMPGLNGAKTTREIMRRCPTAVLVVTASVKTNFSLAFQAMGEGALDVISTPVPGDKEGQAAFLKKIDQIELMIGQKKSPKIEFSDSAPACGKVGCTCSGKSAPCRLVAIGCSAGGPAALADILRALPEKPGAAVAVVQHIDSNFVKDLAVWLNDIGPLPVRLAAEGDLLASGTVWLSGTSGHLEVQADGRAHYTKEPRGLSCMPSVDVMLASIARNWKGSAMGAILTGMGRDGAAGLLAMRKRGFLTLAQDEATSAIFGMPKAAVDNGAAAEVLPLGAMAGRIQKWIQHGD